jgi:hypothetical protein
MADTWPKNARYALRAARSGAPTRPALDQQMDSCKSTLLEAMDQVRVHARPTPPHTQHTARTPTTETTPRLATARNRADEVRG